MSRFYSPHNIDPDQPITLYCLPVKVVIGFVQAFFTIFWGIAAFYATGGVVVPLAIMAMINAVFFLSFATDILPMMIVHFVIQSIFIVFPIGFVICSLIYTLGYAAAYGWFASINKELSNEISTSFKGYSPLWTLFVSIFNLAVYIYYMNLVYVQMRHVELKRYLLRAEPDFETTQGLFQRDETAYDGNERGVNGNHIPFNSIYPKL
ncbi:unnamed protein product [Caenorhabditis angaria]|uniref:Uncharacterized protein n=1 Tax=Caenorhabditis angaria TaxID=860376 RepID=A0A9P1N1A4_9PELO|nr:unnamed protein product [Caenorhabditis angaria]